MPELNFPSTRLVMRAPFILKIIILTLVASGRVKVILVMPSTKFNMFNLVEKIFLEGAAVMADAGDCASVECTSCPDSCCHADNV